MGAADSCRSSITGTPTLDGLTSLGLGAHTEAECLRLDTIVPRIALAAEFIRRVCLDDQYRKHK